MKSRLVLRVEQRPAKGELKKHNAEKGKRYVFVDRKNYPRAKMHVTLRAVKNIRKAYESASSRQHSVDAVMLFTGKRGGLKGLKAEVDLADSTYQLDSPAAVYIPARTRHTYRILKGSGMYIKVVLAPHGDYNAVTR